MRRAMFILMRRAMGSQAWLVAALVVALVVTAGGPVAAGGSTPPAPRPIVQPRLVTIEPSREGGLLVCRVVTEGLPGEKLASSMQSGLVSAIELHLDVLDARRRVVAENRMSVRLAFDLWEEVFAVSWDGQERRLADLDAVRELLADLRHLPVAPLSLLAPGDQFKVRAGLALHAVAPSEKQRVESVIGGDAPPAADRAGGRQEATVSLGRLIRLFYDRGEGALDPASEAESAWFTPAALDEPEERSHAPH